MGHSPEIQRTVSGRGLQGSGPRSRTFGRGRLCGELDCGTRLSIYNGDNYCSRHQARVAPRLRGKKDAPPVAERV
jgi:hypothetical protein